MLEQPIHALESPTGVRDLIDTRGWATIVSANGSESPVVSHLPILLDPDASDITVLSHLARADAETHHLGEREIVLIIEGVDGYMSPSFYRDGPYVPTWNFVVTHLHGRPEILDADQTWRVLEMTVDHFEAVRPEPWRLDTVDEYAQSLAPYTTGFRLQPTRVVGKSKLSQDKPAAVVRRIIDALESDDVHSNPPLARAMRQSLMSP